MRIEYGLSACLCLLLCVGCSAHAPPPSAERTALTECDCSGEPARCVPDTSASQGGTSALAIPDDVSRESAARVQERSFRAAMPTPPSFTIASGTCPGAGRLYEGLRPSLNESEMAEVRNVFRRWIFDPSSLEPSDRGVLEAHGELDDPIGTPSSLGRSAVYCGEAARTVTRYRSNGFYVSEASDGSTVEEQYQNLNLRCDGAVCCSSSLGEYQLARSVIFERSDNDWRLRGAYVASDDATLGGDFVQLGYVEATTRINRMANTHGCATNGVASSEQSIRICANVGVFCNGPVSPRED